MLQILRNKAQSTVIQVMVVIIALVFIFWGVGTNMMNNREAAITVNDEEISFQDFQIAYDRSYEQISAQFGGTLPKELAESLGIKERVINQLIQGALLRQGAAQMGIIVSEEEILNTINGMVQFQENGTFSMDKYKSLLSSNRMTPHKFETNMRFDMLAEKTVRDIGKFASLTSDYEVEELYRQDNEKVSVTYSDIAPESFLADIIVDEAELVTWFENAKENYKSEPQVKLKYFNFSFNEVGSKIAIDEARVSSYYEQNKASFTTPEKRHARHILIMAQPEDSEEVHKEKAQRAAELLTLVKASDDFAALASEYSEGPSKSNGGDLGFFAKGQMIKPFEDAVFTLQPGEVSEVVKTSFGYHIIKLEEIEPASTTSLEDAHDEIVATLQNEEAQALAFQLANSAYEGIISAGSLQAYADTNPEQTLIETDFFTRSTPPTDNQMDDEFLNQAFTLNAGELSSLVKTPAGYYILFAEAIQEPQVPALTQVKEQVETDFIAEKAEKKAEEVATEMLTKLKAGEQFANVVSEFDLEMKDSGLLSKDGSSESKFPQSLLGEAFLLSLSAPYPDSPARSGNGFVVFGFQERVIPDVGEKENLETYRQKLLVAKQQELLSSYINNLQSEAEIFTHPSL